MGTARLQRRLAALRSIAGLTDASSLESYPAATLETHERPMNFQRRRPDRRVYSTKGPNAASRRRSIALVLDRFELSTSAWRSCSSGVSAGYRRAART